MDIEQLFNTRLLAGSECRLRHYSMDNINVVTTSAAAFEKNMRENPSRTLYSEYTPIGIFEKFFLFTEKIDLFQHNIFLLHITYYISTKFVI